MSTENAIEQLPGGISAEGWGGTSVGDGGGGCLGRQLRPLSDTLSAFTVMRQAFFGDGGSDGFSPVKDDIGDGGSGCNGDGGTKV